MTMEDIRVEGKAGRLGKVMTVGGHRCTRGQGLSSCRPHELAVATPWRRPLTALRLRCVPFGLPESRRPKVAGAGEAGAFSVSGLRADQLWRDLFTSRQLTALGTFRGRNPQGQRRDGHQRSATHRFGSRLWVHICARSVIGWLTTALRCAVGTTAARRCGTRSAGSRCPWYGTLPKWMLVQTTSGGYLGAIEWIALF